MIDIPTNLLIKLGKLFLFSILLAGLGYLFILGFNMLLYIIIPWFIPFILALVIALLIEPLVDILERKLRVSRTIAALSALSGFLLFVVLLVSLFVFHVTVEIIELSSRLPEYYKIVRTVLEDAFAQAQYLQYLYLVDLPPALNQLAYNMDNLAVKLRDLSVMIINYVISFVSSLPGILTLVIVSAVATFFLSRDKKVLAQTVLKIVPEAIKPKVMAVSSHLVAALVGFMRAQLILISITALLTILGLHLIGVEYALTVGILVGIVDILPIIGPGIIFIPWSIILLLMGQSGFALAVLTLYAVIVLVRNILEPKVVADNIGLHPLTTLIGIYVGLKALGLIGIFVGPIVIIIAKAIIYPEFKND